MLKHRYRNSFKQSCNSSKRHIVTGLRGYNLASETKKRKISKQVMKNVSNTNMDQMLIKIVHLISELALQILRLTFMNSLPQASISLLLPIIALRDAWYALLSVLKVPTRLMEDEPDLHHGNQEVLQSSYKLTA